MRQIMTLTETASIASTVSTPEVATTTDSAEAQLTNEIADMWRVHTQSRAALHKTRAELKQIRTELSQRLHELKSVLSRPGRGGAWSSFLDAQAIPRSSADRLVRAHEKTISAEPENCLDEQIPEPTDVVVRRYVHALWPRLSKVLTTRDSVQVFVAELNRMAEKSFADHPLLGSALPKSSDLPSYLMHLDLPVRAVEDNAAHT
jgi:hypothetical protein